jgi:hypothetical protein
VSDERLTIAIGKHCTQCGRSTIWPGSIAIANKHNLRVEVVEVICDKCLTPESPYVYCECPSCHATGTPELFLRKRYPQVRATMFDATDQERGTL